MEEHSALKFMEKMSEHFKIFTDRELDKEEIQDTETAPMLVSDLKTIRDGNGEAKTCQSGSDTQTEEQSNLAQILNNSNLAQILIYSRMNSPIFSRLRRSLHG